MAPGSFFVPTIFFVYILPNTEIMVELNVVINKGSENIVAIY
jgi:hypothetical protein